MIKLTQHVNIKLSHFALVVIRPSTHQDFVPQFGYLSQKWTEMKLMNWKQETKLLRSSSDI